MYISYPNCFCGSSHCYVCSQRHCTGIGSYYNAYDKVSECPKCGAPIYEQKTSGAYSFGPPRVHHSCDCRLKMFQPVVTYQIPAPAKPSLSKKKSNARW